MEGKTNLQATNERLREVYENDLNRPLLAQIVQVYGISLRTFAEMFDVSKSHAADILNHKKLPSLELALRLARYYECTVEDLFGWRVDDDGMRRPLLIEWPGTGLMKIPVRDERFSTIGIIKQVIATFSKRTKTQNDTKSKTDDTL